jgi:hypothetical protein
MTRLSTALVGVLVVAVAVAAFLVIRGGDSSDQDAVTQVLSDLETATQEGDAAYICEEIFTPKLAASVSRSSNSGSCATEVRSQLFSPDAEIEVENVEVPDSANATARVTEANGNVSTVHLVKQDGQWRIRSVTPA